MFVVTSYTLPAICFEVVFHLSHHSFSQHPSFHFARIRPVGFLSLVVPHPHPPHLTTAARASTTSDHRQCIRAPTPYLPLCSRISFATASDTGATLPSLFLRSIVSSAAASDHHLPIRWRPLHQHTRGLPLLVTNASTSTVATTTAARSMPRQVPYFS